MKEEKEFPKMSAKQAFATDTKYFTSVSKCPECGDKRRWWDIKSSSFVYCYNCIPDVDMVSKCQISKAEKENEIIIEKLKKKNWTIGVAFGGYNTVK